MPAGRKMLGMARKMVVIQPDGARPVLTKSPCLERPLQDILKQHPKLLPIDEFGLLGPMMVVGLEAPIASGYVDLIGIARGGEVLVVEFKTGPQNSDFRHALAQLLDYGSDLWQLELDEFESTVASQYFASAACLDPRIHQLRTLSAAAAATWPDMSAEEQVIWLDQVKTHLNRGDLHFVLVAQTFGETMERTVQYLNSCGGRARFYMVELVKFEASGTFEARSLVKPTPALGIRSETSVINEEKLLSEISDSSHRGAVARVLDICRGLHLRFEWGTTGCSVRLKVDQPSRSQLPGCFRRGGLPGTASLTSTLDLIPP